MSPARDAVLLTLRALRRRWVAQAFLAGFARWAVALSGVLLGAAAWCWWRGWAMPRWELTAAMLGVSALGAGIVALARRPALARVAARADARGETRDRFQTALAFSQTGGERTAMQRLALRECGEFLADKNFAPLAPVRLPRELAWLAVPAAMLALMHWDAAVREGAAQSERTAAQREVAGTAERLQALAQVAEKATDGTRDEDLKRLAEQLRRAAARLQTEVTKSADAENAALRELSTLEALVKEMAGARKGVSREEIKALAEALAPLPPTREAAREMEKGDLAAAAKELEEAARRSAQERDKPGAEQIARALEEAIRARSQQREISEALRELRQTAQQRAGPGWPDSEALRQLARMLRDAPEQAYGAAGAPSGADSQQTMRSLLAALENMKYGRQSNAGEAQQQGGGGVVTMESFHAKPDDAPLGGLAQAPSGRAGGERDVGTTDSPFGNTRTESMEKGADLALRGQLGEGESLSQFLPGASDDAKSQRRYKELYEAMAPAAQDAVLPEEIPLGSRFFIRRYFEAIRPKE